MRDMKRNSKRKKNPISTSVETPMAGTTARTSSRKVRVRRES
jgi:hypothetical protein